MAKLETIVQVTAPHFCAGVYARNGLVYEVAPILKRHVKVGWTARQLVEYCNMMGWDWVKVPT